MLVRLATLFAFAASTLLAADDFCAVRITVVDEDRSPVGTRAVLIDPDGHAIDSVETDIKGEASFCDFGFGRHAIKVGDEGRGSVTLNDIYFVYGIPQHRTVVLPSTHDVTFTSIPTSCLVYVRVSSETGRKLTDAEATTRSGKRWYADRYGRLEIWVLRGSEDDLTISAPEYATTVMHVACHDFERTERELKLKRQRSE